MGSLTLWDRTENTLLVCPCTFASDKQEALLQPQEWILTSDPKVQKLYYKTNRNQWVLCNYRQQSLQVECDTPSMQLNQHFSRYGPNTPRCSWKRVGHLWGRGYLSNQNYFIKILRYYLPFSLFFSQEYTAEFSRGLCNTRAVITALMDYVLVCSYVF
jgi:hypothetical protein